MKRSTTKWAPLAAAFGCAIVLGQGCVGGAKSSAKDEERLKPYILDAIPADMPEKTDINFENKVHLIGYKIEPQGKVAPGAEVKLTMFWRCDDRLDEGWLLFTHVTDDKLDKLINIDNVGPLRDFHDNRQALAPSAWKKGKFYVDEQSFRVPDDLKSPEIVITTGIWKGDARLKVMSGPADADNRGIVARLKTTFEKTKTDAPVPKLAVGRLTKTEKIKVDGKLDEEAWKKAATTGPLVDVGSGKPNVSSPVNGSAKVLWDDENLYVGVDVADSDIIGGFPKDAKDPHLWTKDTVELMLDPDGDGDNLDYYEIQVGPQNLVFDTQYDSYNIPKTEPNGPFGHQEWSSKLKSAVVIDGTIDKSDDKDKGYTVEMAIPWASFTKAKNHPPKPGDTWRMNLYAMKNNGGVAWSPILGEGNFHKASRFGRVTWLDQAAAPAASAASAAGSAVRPPPPPPPPPPLPAKK
jgi:hypothetical protein